MSEKVDRRKKRTRQLLRKALLELIEERGLDKVTVSDLTERAEINRGTFYLHYQDVPHLMEQLKSEIFDGMKEHMVKLNPYEIASYVDKDLCYPPVVDVLQYLSKNSDFFQVIFGPKGDAEFPMQIKSFLTENLYLKVFAHIPEDENAFVPREYLIAFLASANLGVITHWIQTGFAMKEEKLALIVTRILHKGPLAIFTTIQKPI